MDSLKKLSSHLPNEINDILDINIATSILHRPLILVMKICKIYQSCNAPELIELHHFQMLD